MTIKEKADEILYKTGLYEELKTYGEPHPIGSYRMDMMVYNDLDIDILNNSMTLEKLHTLTNYILKTFRPTWYEAREEVNDEGKTVWFHGFHAILMDELWNFDLWFFDRETITKAEAYCDTIPTRCHQNPTLKTAITTIKKDLLTKGLYHYDKYTSMDVYHAVLTENITTTQAFLKTHPLTTY